MFNRFNFKEKIMPTTLSEQIDQHIDQALPKLQDKESARVLRLWKTEKNLINTRLDNMLDSIALYRLSENQKWLTGRMFVILNALRSPINSLVVYKNILSDELAEDQPDLKKKIENYVPQTLARTYVYVISALDAFDGSQPDTTPQLKAIYPQEKKIEDWKADIAEADERLENWKHRNQAYPKRIAFVEEFIQFFQGQLNEGPLRKVRFKI